MSDSSLFTDGIIRVKDTEIKVHKAVLASQSSIFHNLLNSKLEESQTNVIEIEDFRAEVVIKMVKYINIDKVYSIQNMASKVPVIADDYKLDRSKTISEHSFVNSFITENVCERFGLS